MTLASGLLALALVAVAWAELRLRTRPVLRAAGELGRAAGSLEDLAAEADELERRRAHLLAQVSHDLRSPLSVIRATSWALGRDEPPAGRRRRLAVIDDEVDRAATLVDDLIALGRAGSHGLPLRPVPTACAVLLHEVVARRDEIARGRGVTLTVELTEPDLVALVDPGRLRQIVANLVENAIRHAPPGGTVRVSAGIPDDELVVVVEDDGPGLGAGAVESLFVPFQVGETPGTAGLGLAIAHELAAAHGGWIAAESRGEGGARFAVGLPCAGRVDSLVTV